MSQFIVDGAHLRALARYLSDLSGRLEAITIAAPDYSPYVGGTALADEILDFNHAWRYGVTEVSGEIVHMVGRLDQAATAYENADRHVGDGHLTPVGPPPSPHGPGGVHHHPGAGAGVGGAQHHPHPRPVRPGTGSGTGTTTIGGSGGGGKGGGAHGGGIGGSHAPTTVHSDLLTSGQETFVAKLSALTGLNPRVVGAWTLAEESSGAARQRQRDDNNDWLNIGYDDSGRVGSSYGSVWSDPTSAAEQSARFLEGKWDGADPSIQRILDAAGKSPDEQIRAIYTSKWASSHYNDGALLHSTYDALSGMTVTRA